MQEFFGFRQSNVYVTFDVHFDAEIIGAEIKNMATKLSVIVKEVKMIAGHADRSRIRGRPEADECSTTISTLEYALMFHG